MSFWSSNPRQSQDRLKVLPGGSRDFHQVLDEILFSGETQPETYSSDEPVSEWENEKSLNDIPIDKNNNNSNREFPLFVSNTSPNLKCCFCQCRNQLYDLYTNARLTTNLIQTKSCPDFPAILKMGTTCSSNAYDHRDWHNVADGCPLEHNKQGRRSRKKQATGKDGESNGLPAGSVCTCNASSDAVDASEGLSKTHIDKRSWLTLQNGAADTQGNNQINNRLSPIVDSTGHIKLSRLFSSGRARATSSCDVSPHRLLTRRNNSPSGRSPFTFDPRTSYSDAMRQRSHSWSYGKYGNRPNYLKPASTARASVLSPPGQQKLMSSSSLQNTQNLGSQNKSTTSAKTLNQESCKKEAQVVHETGCPLHVAACEYIRSDTASGPDTSGTCLSPVMRQRSASESHTTRPRRILPRPTTGASNGQDHVHVRWADEEDGSSLSTSVLLSSIRPRSYSYGATDSAPHRPILKKVAGL